MGRWLVILSLAVAQCADVAEAATPSSGIPLPKPRPMRRERPALAIKGVDAPSGGKPVVKTAIAEPPATKASPLPGSAVQESPDLPLPAFAPQDQTQEEKPVQTKFGKANRGCGGGKRIISAYYREGERTASGQRFDPKGMTAAHRTLPFGTRLTVSNPRTGKSVTVVINDRGPFVSGVSLDLSLGAAQAIGMRGTGAVCIH